MKIRKLHIDGFGIFHDKNIKGFTQGINVMYGPNEAGKSTLLDFIRFTLFEYPHHLADRRAPINGGDHSGTIYLTNSTGASLAVYRHGNAKGFQLEYKGKTTEDESRYHNLIGNASIDLYKNIYAISLDELNDVEQLGKSGMEDRIFSMGMGLSGVDFGSFEDALVQHAKTYFLTRGSVQILPKLVKEIQSKEASINELRSKLGKYNRLSEDKEKIDAELEILSEKQSQLNEKKNDFTNWSKAYPDYVKYKEMTSKINAIGEIEIHANQVLEEYENQKKKIDNETAEIAEIDQEIKQLEKTLNHLNWDQALSKKAGLLDFFKRNVKLYEEAKSKYNQEKEKLSNAKSRSQSILSRLGKNLKAEDLINLKGSFELQSEATRVADKQNKINQRIDAKTESAARLEQEFSQFKSQKNELEKAINDHSIQDDTQKTKEEEKFIALETAFKSALEERGGNFSKGNKLPFILALIFMGVGGAIMFMDLISGGTVLGVATISLIIVFLQKKRDPVQTYMGQSPNAINEELNTVKTALQRYDQLQEKHKDIIRQFKFKKQELEKATEEVDLLKKKRADLIDNWIVLLEEKNLPKDLIPASMNDFISNVEELKRQKSNAVEAKKAIENFEKLISDFENKLKQVAPESTDLDVSYVHQLIKKIEANEKVHAQRQQVLEDLEKQSKVKALKTEFLQQTHNKIKALLSKVKAKDETALYHHFEQQKTLEEAQSEKQNAINTIKTLCGVDQLEETIEKLAQYTPSELEAKKEATATEFEEVKFRYDEQNKESASLRTEIRLILEVDDMYGFQNEKESLQAQLKEETKEWLTTQLALKVLEQSKQKYEKERQPEVITQTRDFFRTITENAYEDLRISLSEKHVSIIDASGNAKTVDELSRGTKEQLLLSLRLGLIAEYEKNAEPLPVAFDDIMVNSDKERTNNLVQLITDFAKTRQVLYFTCHEHTRDLFASHGANIIEW